MKISIWIRPGRDGKPTQRTDYKYESADSPGIQRYGRNLLDALEGGSGQSEEQEQKARERMAEIAALLEKVKALDFAKCPALNAERMGNCYGVVEPWSKMSVVLDCFSICLKLQKELAKCPVKK